MNTQTCPGIEDRRWLAVKSRDRAADGTFYYAVKTTGIYCRPSCGARLPKRAHVRFYESREAAEAAGFRPCLRCRPQTISLSERQAALVTHACRLIEAAETAPDLAALAASAGLSRHHFHRIFRAQTGLTPRAYATAVRRKRVASALAAGRSITYAYHEAGFGSSSRFYEQADSALGMSPTAFRAGGRDETIRFALGACSLGSVLVAATAKGICAILLGDEPEPLLHDLEERFPHARLIGGDTEFEHWVAKVIGFIEAPQLGLDLPLDIRGTAFQQRVWQALRAIPPGTTLSYAELARKLGLPTAVRALAGACAANQIAVAIPCHRVVRTDGSLAGYRWGIARKQALLTRERS